MPADFYAISKLSVEEEGEEDGQILVVDRFIVYFNYFSEWHDKLNGR